MAAALVDFANHKRSDCVLFPHEGVRKRGGGGLAFFAVAGRLSFWLELRDFHTVVLDISSDMLISEGSDLRSGQRKRRRAGGVKWVQLGERG